MSDTRNHTTRELMAAALYCDWCGSGPDSSCIEWGEPIGGFHVGSDVTPGRLMAADRILASDAIAAVRAAAVAETTAAIEAMLTETRDRIAGQIAGLECPEQKNSPYAMPCEGLLRAARIARGTDTGADQ